MNFNGPRPLAYSEPKAADCCLLRTMPLLLVLRSEKAGNLRCANGDYVSVITSSQHRGSQKQRLWGLALSYRRVSDFAQALSRAPSRN